MNPKAAEIIDLTTVHVGETNYIYQRFTPEQILVKGPNELYKDAIDKHLHRIMKPEQLKNFYGFPENLDIDRYRIDGDPANVQGLSVAALRRLLIAAPQTLTHAEAGFSFIF